MFTSMLKSLVNISNKQNKNNSESKQNSIDHKRQDIVNVLRLLNEIKDDDSTENIVDSKVVPLDIRANELSISSKNDTKSIEKKHQILPVEPTKESQLLNQIKSLQCLFTWNLKTQKGQDNIAHIRNKYGDYNLDISISEFTFVR